jgi:WD40 repeat protein
MTKRSLALSLAIVPIFSVTAFAQEKVTYQDHVLPIFRNSCLNCHNPDKKKADLDLSTFTGVMAGGGSGKAIEPGNPDGSLLYRLVMHVEEPNMPPKGGKLPEKDLNTIKAWIAGGTLETSGSSAIASNKPKLDLAVAVNATGKPDGPPPMPADLLLEPVVHTSRAGAITSLAASPWAPLVAVGGQRQILLYNPKTTDLLGVLPFPDGQPNVLRFARSGKLLLAGGGEGAKSGKVALYDVTTGNRITELGEEFDAVLAADITSDQSLVALGGPSRVVKIFDVATGATVKQIKKHTDWVTAIAYSPDAVLLATGDRAGNLHVWEARSGNAFYTLPGHKAAVTELAFRGDSNVLASASEDGTIRLWDMQAGKQIKSINAHPGGVLSLAFTHDGRLVSSGRDRKLRIWKPDGSPIKESEPFKDIVLRSAFNEDGSLAIGGDWTGDIRVITAADAKLAAALELNPPTLATRVAIAEKLVADAQPAHDKLQAELARVRDEETKANAHLLAAKQAGAAANESLGKAQAALAAASASEQQSAAELKAAEGAVATAKAESQRLAEAKMQAVAARDVAVSAHRAADDAAKRALASADEATAIVARAEVLHRFSSIPITEAVLASAEQDAQRLRQGADAAQAAVEPLAQQLQPLIDTAAKAEADADAIAKSIPDLDKRVADRRAAHDPMATLVATATAAMSRAKADADAAKNAVAQRTAQASAASQIITKIRPKVDESAATLASARAQLAKWQAATVNVSLVAAKQELAKLTAEQAKLLDASKQADAAQAKVSGDVAAMEKLIAEGPARIAALTAHVATSRDALAIATKSTELLSAALAERTGLAGQSADLLARLRDAAAKSPDNATLAAATAKSQESLTVLQQGLAAAEQSRTLAAIAQEKATAALGVAERALSDEQSATAARPAQLDQLKQSAVAAAKAAATAKSTADTAAAPLAAAKAKVDQLSAEFARLKQQAAAPQLADAKVGAPR